MGALAGKIGEPGAVSPAPALAQDPEEVLNVANGTAVDKVELARLYESGMQQWEIAPIFGVTQATISRWLKKAGVPIRPPSKRPIKRGPEHGAWKGSDAAYSTLHRRVIDLRGQPAKCDQCGRTGGKATGRGTDYHWANLTGNYADPYDYRRLCRSCHMRHDEVGKRSNATRVRTVYPHGTLTRYGNGCHCAECRGANAAAQRAHRGRMERKPRKVRAGVKR